MSLTTLLPCVAGIFTLLYYANQVNCQNIPRARDFPLCISPDDPVLARDPNYMQFKKVIQHASSYFNPTPLKQKLKTDHKVEHELFEWIRFSKIKLDVINGNIPNKKTIDMSRPLGNGNTFNQWIHITVRTKKKINGLIVQANHGPLGIPFGNFGEFIGKEYSSRCECIGITEQYHNGLAIPCTYKSKAALTHPDVYIFHHAYVRKFKDEPMMEHIGKPAMELHFNFNFVDVICHRASTIQFLIMAIEDFGVNGAVKAEAVLTETYYQDTPQSFDGIPYPFHPDFCNAIDCGYPETNTLLRKGYLIEFEIAKNPLRYNIEYDLCVQYGPPNKADKGCPPGPFKCLESMTTDPATSLKEESVMIEKLIADQSSCACKDDIPIVAKEDRPTFKTTTTFPWTDSEIKEPQRYDDNSTMTTPETESTTHDSFILTNNEKTILETLASIPIRNTRIRTLHGIFMFFAFSIAGSISIFLARFDKDLSPGVGCWAKGTWLWGHILFAFLSLTMMWAGIAILGAISDDYSRSLKPIHILFGVLAMSFFHLDYFFGWIRPIGRNLRQTYITVHTILGYLSKLCAACTMNIMFFFNNIVYFGEHFDYLTVITMLVTRVGVFPFTQFIVIVVEFANLLFYVGNTVVQLLTDSRMELKSRRRICPYVEHKKLNGPVPAICKILRNIILIIHICTHVLIFIIAVSFWVDPGKLRSYYDIYLPGNWGNSTASVATSPNS